MAKPEVLQSKGCHKKKARSQPHSHCSSIDWKGSNYKNWQLQAEIDPALVAFPTSEDEEWSCRRWRSKRCATIPCLQRTLPSLWRRSTNLQLHGADALNAAMGWWHLWEEPKGVHVMTTIIPNLTEVGIPRVFSRSSSSMEMDHITISEWLVHCWIFHVTRFKNGLFYHQRIRDALFPTTDPG